MDVDVDHYNVLGLPSGEEGARLSQQQINKAYRLKAMVLHPDKRRLDDPDAHAEFVKLQTSYLVLKDEKARKLFDDLLRVKREKLHLQARQDSKRQKMMSELEMRERSALVFDTCLEAQKEEERIFKKLKEEIDSIRLTHAKKKAPGIAHFEKAGKENKEGGRHVLSDLSNPLHGLPRQPASTPSGFVTERNEPGGPKSRNLVGAGFQAFEESVLDKLMKKSAKRPK